MPPPPPSVDAAPRIRRVTLSSAAIAAEQAWWTGRLGLASAPGAPAGGFAVTVGNGVLAFAPVDSAPAAPGGHAAPSHHVALEVAEDRLVPAAEWLAGAAPLLPLPDGETIVDFPAWVAHSVYARSPGGHVVELIARHRRPWRPDAGVFDAEAPAAAPAAEGPDLVRGISEVGVCTPDVPALVDRLQGLGAGLWFGEPASGFAAVGDEAGLLICVREWRPWFPTDRPAVPGPATIEVAGLPGLTPGEPVPVGSATELLAAATD